MICRACLRAGVRAEATAVSRVATPFSQRLLLQTQARTQRSLSSIASQAVVPFRAQQSQSGLPLRQQRRTYSAEAASPASEAASAALGPEKPDFLSDGESQVWDILIAEFGPTELVVQDISGGCGSMYGIEIASEKFRGLNMLKQQRLVNAALGDLVKEWHGVQLKTRVPSS